MSEDKKDFNGKEVADAIKKACESFGVPQERLDIEVLELGSTGIFGLIRRKAKIRASVKKEEVEVVVETPVVASVSEKREKKTSAPRNVEESSKKDSNYDLSPKREAQEDLSEENVALVKEVLIELLEKMQFPSTVEVSVKGIEVQCRIEGEYDEYLTGQDGKTLDSIQYLLRKIVARKTPERIKLSVDVGDFREKRKESLKERAVELADLVKVDGKTQVIPALNPSERRVVHMILQDDKEIRSRSVGDGLFKKILIYKPGKGNKSGDGRKRNHSRNRRSKNSRPNKKDEK